VVVGDVCKIRGEVTESVLMNYSNKQHYGFLGNAFVGRWVNMGAGTCNSDLKNTYGKISVKKGSGKIKTGEQFLGCVIGDYSKSAINTSIFTGKTIGVNSYLYGFIDEDVPSFVSFMKYLSCGSFTLNVEKAIETQQRMFLRRNYQQKTRDIELLKFVFQATQNERDVFFSNE
jgi:glucose-1-phosphate thymidylyltransferase